MSTHGRKPTTIDEYITDVPATVQPILRTIRQIIRTVAPDAQEMISYRMPAFREKRVFIFFAAFKAHIGIYPPVHGDPALELDLAPYRGPKGNLKFQLDEDMPYDLIRRVAVALRVQHSG